MTLTAQVENTAHGEKLFDQAVKALSSPASLLSDEDELAARAAWLHHAGGLTQSAVAKRLGLQPTRAHRLIARAAKEGLVRVFVDCEVVSCIQLEDDLMERYGLSHCSVVPDISDDPELPLRSLSIGGSQFLMRVLEQKTHRLIGIGHGRTLSGVVDALPSSHVDHATYVSLLGGLTRKFAANPYDVIFRLAEKGGAQAYFLPAPMFADSIEDRELMLRQAGLAEVMRHIHNTSLCLLGIGVPDDGVDSVTLGSLSSEAVEVQASLPSLGVKAELLGQFLNTDGQLVSTPFDSRMMAPTLDSLSGKEVVAIAGGRHKLKAIAATLRGGWLTGLITDEVTARHLVDSVDTADQDD